jgi:hypothetical protein
MYICVDIYIHMYVYFLFDLSNISRLCKSFTILIKLGIRLLTSIFCQYIYQNAKSAYIWFDVDSKPFV